MAEIINDFQNSGCEFKEACCIDAGKVYDSCCDRDCLEDLRCFFTADAQSVINSAISVKLRSAEVVSAYINVEPVNFNRGFYSCDITFFFVVELDVYTAPHSCPVIIRGATSFNKRVILYGGDGNVKVFSSSLTQSENCKPVTERSSNAPRCVVQSVDPVALSCRLCKLTDTYENICVFPEIIAKILGGAPVADVASCAPIVTVYVTLGLFTVVQLIRQVQILIPVYDFCIPEKQCDDTADQPCDIFRRIKFPTDDFFPANQGNAPVGPGCGCGEDEE